MKNILKKYKFQSSLIFVLLVGIFFIITYLNNLKIPFTNIELFELEKPEKPFYLRNIIFALAAIATAIFTWWRNSLNQKQTEINQKQTEIQFNQLNKIQTQIEIQSDTRLDSLFSQAVEFLKSENDLITRKGGVHILKDLALSSPKHAQKCLDMLCSLNESWMPFMLDENPDFFDLNKDFININNLRKIIINKLPDNIEKENLLNQMYLSQLVLKSLSDIIKHISLKSEYEDKYNLSYKYLCSIDLRGVNFDNKFILENVNLQSAILKYSNLQSSYLIKAKLQFANLNNANLISAQLIGAELQSANLIEAKLLSCDLTLAILNSANLSNAKLQKSILFETNFESAILRKANLQSSKIEYSNFKKAKLNAADFRNAKNIDTAEFDDNKVEAIFTDEDYYRHLPLSDQL